MNKRASLFAVAGALLLVNTSQAIPVEYTIFDTDTLETLGSLTVDPALAAPAGLSNVTLSALTLTETLGVFGSVTLTLADYTGGIMPLARFEDGVIQSLSANTAFNAGGVPVSLDITPEGPELSFVGILQILGDPLGENEIGPIRGIGIEPTSVPEPMMLSLFAAGMLGLGLLRRRRAAPAP